MRLEFDAIGVTRNDFSPILSVQLSKNPYGPIPPRFDEAHSDPFIQEQLRELADVLRNWWPYVAVWTRPFVLVWIAAIEQALAAELAPQSIRALRGMMRSDVEEHEQMLWKAKKPILEAWISFHPEWVNYLIKRRAETDPLLLLRPHDYAEAKRKAATAADTMKHQGQRARKLTVDLFLHVLALGGEIIWSAEDMAKSLSSKKGGPRLKPDKVAEAAANLVRIDVADWVEDPDLALKRFQIIPGCALSEPPSAMH